MLPSSGEVSVSSVGGAENLAILLSIPCINTVMGHQKVICRSGVSANLH